MYQDVILLKCTVGVNFVLLALISASGLRTLGHVLQRQLRIRF